MLSVPDATFRPRVRPMPRPGRDLRWRHRRTRCSRSTTRWTRTIPLKEHAGVIAQDDIARVVDGGRWRGELGTGEPDWPAEQGAGDYKSVPVKLRGVRYNGDKVITG